MGNKLIYLFVVILAVIGVVLIMHSPYFAVRTISVVGVHQLKDEEVIEASGIKEGDNIFLIPAREVVNRLMEHVRIKGVKLQRQFPDSLVLVVNERPGLALFTKGDKLMELGEDGAILATYAKGSNHPELPYIEGVRFAVLGSQVEMSPGLKSTLTLLKGISPLHKEVSKVSYAPGDIELILKSEVKVYFGHPDNIKENIEVYRAIMQNPPNTAGEIEYIDLRYTGKPVIQTK